MIEKVEMVNGLVIYLVVRIWGAKKKKQNKNNIEKQKIIVYLYHLFFNHFCKPEL